MPDADDDQRHQYDGTRITEDVDEYLHDRLAYFTGDGFVKVLN